jgi:hypothetical protein
MSLTVIIVVIVIVIIIIKVDPKICFDHTGPSQVYVVSASHRFINEACQDTQHGLILRKVHMLVLFFSVSDLPYNEYF